MGSASLEDLKQRIESAAGAAECAVVEAVVLPGTDTRVPFAQLDSQQFVDLLGKVRPAIVYLHADILEAEADIVEELDGDGDGAIGNDRRVKALVRQWKSKDGEISMLVASFMKNGILHTLLKTPEWREHFDMAIEELRAAIADETGAREDELTAGERAEIQNLAAQLAKHPKFTASRDPSREKRLFLASQLFPECEEYKLQGIVTLAANMAWFAKEDDV